MIRLSKFSQRREWGWKGGVSFLNGKIIFFPLVTQIVTYHTNKV